MLLGERKGLIAAEGIWKLFRVLTTWKRQPESGLTLELNTQSPSDWEHWFKNFYFASDAEGNDTDETGDNWHDPPHGWVHGQQVKAPPQAAIRRLFGNLDICFREEPLEVESVTCLIIRRQVRRFLGWRGLSSILRKLSSLEDLIYEPWRQWEIWWRVIHDEGRYPFPTSQIMKHSALTSGRQNSYGWSRIVFLGL